MFIIYDILLELFFIIPVIVITKFEKSELIIRIGDMMDNVDRKWELFTNSIIRIYIRKVRIFLSRRFTNEKVRFMSSVARRFLYYLVILASAFLLTRDDLSHNWRIEWRDTNMEVNEFSKHFMEYVVLFLIMII